MARSLRSVLNLGVMLVAVACGGGTPSARSADDESKTAHDDPSWYDSGAEESGSSSPSPKPSSTSDRKKKSKPTESTAAEPTFTEGMSVNDAINAIPQGYERVNIDQEDLDRPLLDPEFYKPCKLAHSQRFEIKFAVWEGRAVGVDIKTTPANKSAETCLRGLLAKNVWRDKVKSLNISTVTF
jgi:hypothetical protein